MDRSDPGGSTVPRELRESVAAIQRSFVGHCSVDVTVWSRTSVHQLLALHDAELAHIYSRINPQFPALLADVARVALMLRFGGVYNDVSYRFKDVGALCSMLRLLRRYDAVFETHPKEPRMRNTNMAAARPNLDVFRDCLLLMKRELALRLRLQAAGAARDAESGRVLYGIGSRTLIRLVTNNGTMRLGAHGAAEGVYGSGRMRVMRWGRLLSWDRAFKRRVNANVTSGEDVHWSRLQRPLFV